VSKVVFAVKRKISKRVNFIAESPALKRRPAFSLVAVLILAIAGMAVIGGVMYTFDAFSGSARMTVSGTTEYNVLQDAVERGKSFLREEMTKTGVTVALRAAPPSQITSHRDLLIQDSGTVIGHFVVSEDMKGLGGHQSIGVLNVYIYDMQYDPATVNPGMTDAERAALPPSLNLTATGSSGGVEDGTPGGLGGGGGGSGGPTTSAGAYLIRATLVREDGRQKSIETALVQAVGEVAP
jgi:hypothetical protein